MLVFEARASAAALGLVSLTVAACGPIGPPAPGTGVTHRVVHYRGGVHPNVDGYRTIGGALASSIKMKLLGSGPPPTACGPPPVAKPECVAPCGVALPWLPPP